MKEKHKKFYKNLRDIIKSHKGNIIITSHISPDGDAISSILAIKYYLVEFLKIPSIKINTVITGVNSESFYYFKEARKIKFVKDIVNEVNRDTLIIIVDAKEYNRLSYYENSLREKVKKSICIDHHAYKDKEAFTLSFTTTKTEYNSTAEMIFLLLFEKHLKELDKEICEILLYGIYSDTGNFTFIRAGLTHSMAIAKQLIEQGNITVEKLLSNFGKVNTSSLEFLGKYLTNLKTKKVKGWPIFSYTYVNKSDIKKYSEGDISEGTGLFKGYLKSIKNVNWGFQIRPDILSNDWKVSFRSIPGFKDSINVKEICKNFKGGGHDLAAGCIIKEKDYGKLNEEKVLNIILDYLKITEPTYI